jgi:hypothetical protein
VALGQEGSGGLSGLVSCTEVTTSIYVGRNLAKQHHGNCKTDQAWLMADPSIDII